MTQASETIDRRFLTVAEVGQSLGIGRTKAYELVRNGTIPSVMIGGRLRVWVKALDEWCEARAREATSWEYRRKESA